MKNYAVDSGKKFFMFFDCKQGKMIVQEVLETGARFTSYGEFMANRNLLHDSLMDCLKSIDGYTKPVIYRGENINVWQPDIFISYNHYNGEYYSDYHFDDSILRKYEVQA